jgi:hypothetical protein
MPGRVAAAVAGLCLLAGGAAACDSGEDGPGGAQARSTPTTVEQAGCPVLPGPPGDVAPANAPGDFDGDAGVDRLLTYRVTAGGPWRVRADLARGGGAEAELPATEEGVKAVGGYRLDVGPAEAAFAVVGRGPDGVNLGLFVLRGCRLERVTLEGVPAAFPVGSAAATRNGLACQAPGLVAYQATSTGGGLFRGTAIGYLLVGVILDEANRSTSTLGAEGTDLARYASFSCGALSL